MINKLTIFMAVIFAIAGWLLFHLPEYLNKGEKKYRGNELAKLNPKYFWIKVTYPLFGTLWTIVLFFGSLCTIKAEYWPYLVGINCAGFMAFNGLFAIIFNVCPVYHGKMNYYFFIGMNKRIMGIKILFMCLALDTVIYTIAYFQNIHSTVGFYII